MQMENVNVFYWFKSVASVFNDSKILQRPNVIQQDKWFHQSNVVRRTSISLYYKT